MTILDWIRRRPSIKWMVQDQVRAGDPPEVRETYDRLRSAGYSDRQAWTLLASALEAEMASMRREGRVFDRSAYARRLAELPGTMG